MITALESTPDHVIGFRASGTIEAQDYRDVLLPAIERAATSGEIRIVVVFEDFDELTGGAVLQDMKLGTHHLSAWKKTAFVSDIEWMQHLVALFGWMSPGEVRRCPLAELDAALAWAAA